MTYPIGTLLGPVDGNRFVAEADGRVLQVSGAFSGTRWPWRPWMTPVPCPPNVVESPTVPDWASSVPMGGLVIK